MSETDAPFTDRRRVRRGGRRITDLGTHEEAFVTPLQLAHHLGCDRRQVMKWIGAGALPAYRFGELWRIKLGDAQSFVQRSQFSASETSASK